MRELFLKGEVIIILGINYLIMEDEVTPGHLKICRDSTIEDLRVPNTYEKYERLHYEEATDIRTQIIQKLAYACLKKESEIGVALKNIAITKEILLNMEPPKF